MPTDKETLEFLNKDECVKEGEIEQGLTEKTIKAKWRTNDQVVSYVHYY